MSLPRAEEWTDPGSMDPPPTRWGRRLLAATGMLLVALAGSFAIWWGMSLRRLPDIGPPFDLNADSARSIPETENAFIDYRAAASMLVGEQLADRFGRFPGWPQLTQLERDWFFANAPAIERWLEGTAKDRSINNQAGLPRDETPVDVDKGLRILNLLARIAGSRMESEGEPDEAWYWYRSGLRASRHSGMRGSFAERLEGIALYTDLAESIRVWSDHPGLSRTAIRQALDDLIAINAMTPSLSENLRSEYLATKSLLDDPERSGSTEAGRTNPKASWKERFARFLKREPERSRRLMNLIFANWLSVDGSPGKPAPEELDRWLPSTLYLKHLLPPFNAFEKAERREAALRAALVIDLAERLYARDHGKRPESPEELVGPYLKALPEGSPSINP
jgi:hypothetical protein